MDRIKLLTINEAPEGSKEVLADLEQKMGKVINIFKAMANSPAVLKNYFAIDTALKEKSISADLAERIAVRIAKINGCQYCFAAHSYLASKIIDKEEVLKSAEGESNDKKIEAALDFAETVMKKSGNISDEDFVKIKSAGYSDAEILEIGAVVAQNFFTNVINNISQTKVDFPKI